MPDNIIKERFGGIELKQLIVPFLILILIFGTIIGIYNYQKNANNRNAPALEVYKPSNSQEVTEAQVVLEGKTDSKSVVVVNEKEVNVDSSGNFASEVPIAEGINVITVKSTKKSGKSTTTQLKVTRVTPVPVTNEAGTSNSSIPEGATNLDSSGPENFWIPEASLLAAAGTTFIASLRSLKRAKTSQR